MTEEHFRSKSYMTFLIIFMGFTALTDQYLSLIESTAIPFMLDHFNIGVSTFTFWQGIVGILAFFVFVVSWLGDLYGRRIGMLILILIMCIPAVLIGFIGGNAFWIFMILYGIMIMGTNVNFWAVPIAEESPENKRALNGTTVFLIGLIPLYAVIGVAINDTLGWEWMWGVMGVFGLGTLILWFFMRETKRWEDNKEEFKNSADTIRKSFSQFTSKDWKFIGLAGFTYICWSTAFKITTSTIGIFFIDVKGLTPEQWEDGILIFAGLLTIVGALTIGIIMERFGRMVAFVYSVGGSVLAFAGLALFGDGGYAMAIYYFMSCVLGFMLVYNAEMVPTNIRGTGIGLLSTLARLGFVFGPLIASIILPEIASPAALGSYVTLYFVAAFIMFLPFFTLIFNRYETKGQTLETIKEALTD